MEDAQDSLDTSSSTHTQLHTNTLTASQFLNLCHPSNPFWLENGDNFTVILITDLLTINNYVTWSHAMQQALHAKNKHNFISSAISQPTDPEDPLLELWECCNDMVVS